MIGDREDPRRDDEGDTATPLPPLDAMHRLNPPPPTDDHLGITPPPVWVERYDRMVIVRHVFPGSPDGATTERVYPSEAAALRGYATQIGVLRGRGYTDVPTDR